jgi:hypothetical protein
VPAVAVVGVQLGGGGSVQPVGVAVLVWVTVPEGGGGQNGGTP